MRKVYLIDTGIFFFLYISNLRPTIIIPTSHQPSFLPQELLAGANCILAILRSHMRSLLSDDGLKHRGLRGEGQKQRTGQWDLYIHRYNDIPSSAVINNALWDTAEDSCWTPMGVVDWEPHDAPIWRTQAQHQGESWKGNLFNMGYFGLG